MDAKNAELMGGNHPPVFRLFTRESITKIAKRIQEEKLLKEQQKEQEQEAPPQTEEEKDEEKPRPNPALSQGNPLPNKMGDVPPEMCGMPIEEIDEFYQNKYVSNSAHAFISCLLVVMLYQPNYCSFQIAETQSLLMHAFWSFIHTC